MSLVRTKVAVLRGGISQGYEESLKTGNYLLNILRDMPEKYEPLDIFISRDGEWHYKGVAEDPHYILSKIHIAWNGLHGELRIQNSLDAARVPYVGSSTLASALAHNKEMAKNVYRQHDLLTPESELIVEPLDEEQLIKIFRTYLSPMIVKPATGVGGIGIMIAHTFNELKEAVRKCFSHSPKVLVEEYVGGTVVTGVVIEGAKGEELHALVPLHIETERRRVRPRVDEMKEVERMSKVAHEILGLRHYSASDFVITPRGKIYILETNATPLFYEDSFLHQSLLASGWKPSHFTEHCLNLVLNK